MTPIINIILHANIIIKKKKKWFCLSEILNFYPCIYCLIFSLDKQASVISKLLTKSIKKIIKQTNKKLNQALQSI